MTPSDFLTKLGCVLRRMEIHRDAIHEAIEHWEKLDKRRNEKILHNLRSECQDELALAEAATDVRMDAAALVAAAQEVLDDAILWEQATWETYWNCITP